MSAGPSACPAATAAAVATAVARLPPTPPPLARAPARGLEGLLNCADGRRTARPAASCRRRASMHAFFSLGFRHALHCPQRSEGGMMGNSCLRPGNCTPGGSERRGEAGPALPLRVPPTVLAVPAGSVGSAGGSSSPPPLPAKPPGLPRLPSASSCGGPGAEQQAQLRWQRGGQQVLPGQGRQLTVVMLHQVGCFDLQ